MDRILMRASAGLLDLYGSLLQLGSLREIKPAFKSCCIEAMLSGTIKSTGDREVASSESNALGSQVKIDPNGDIYLVVGGLASDERR